MLMRMGILSTVVALSVGFAVVHAQETLPADTKATTAGPSSLEDQYSYAIGLQMGTSFRNSEIKLVAQQVLAGIQDGLAASEPRFDDQACMAAMQKLDTLMRDKAMAQQRAAGGENRKRGAAFLEQNLKREGVKATSSGLQYKILQPGTGATPKLTDTVRCNYRGTLIDGTEFDASANHGGPATFPVSGVIAGWTEALQMMKVGAKWQLYIPADLAYGDDQRGPVITPGSTLVFDIELLGIEGQ